MMHNEVSAKAWMTARPEYNPEVADKLDMFVSLLAEENGRQNLVAAASLESVWMRHIVDSAQLLDYVPRGTKPTWVDLGTGSGFPGLIISILRPDIPLLMVESRARRIEWLERAKSLLQLRNAKVWGGRLEAMADSTYDVISARAFAPLPTLLQVAARFSTDATLWLLPKGQSSFQELADLRGWNHTFHVEHSLTNSKAGIVVGKLAGRKGRS